MCDHFKEGGRIVAGAVNNLFRNKEPWQIVLITTGTVVSAIYLIDQLNQDECNFLIFTLPPIKLLRH